MIGMPDCFKMKTHPNLMKFKGRNVYLWIKAWNDLLLVVTEVVTALFNREREGKWGSAREKVPSVMLSMNQQSRQTNKRLVGFDTSWEHMISKWSLQKGGGVSGKRAEVFFCFFQLITCLLREVPTCLQEQHILCPSGAQLRWQLKFNGVIKHSQSCWNGRHRIETRRPPKRLISMSFMATASLCTHCLRLHHWVPCSLEQKELDSCCNWAEVRDCSLKLFIVSENTKAS